MSFFSGEGGRRRRRAPTMADLPSEAGSCLIIGAEADGVGPSVLLTCAGSQRQYLFGAAEGFSRLALECRARPTAKLRAVFLSSFRPRASGGLGGLLLRLCADGHESVCLAGPPGVGTHVEALRDFTRFRHPEVTALRLVPPGLRRDVFAPDDTRACDAAAESYRDDAVMVFPLFAPLAGAKAAETCQVCAALDEEARAAESSSSDAEMGATGRSASEETSKETDREETRSSDDDAESAFARHRHKQRRTTKEDASKRESMRKRRNVLGYACAIRDDASARRRRREMDSPSPEETRVVVFLVLDCADDADARAAAANATVRCCLRSPETPETRRADRAAHPPARAAFHLTPRDVASRPAYDAARRGSPEYLAAAHSNRPSIMHVDCSVAGEVGFRAGARTLAKLHAVDPETFPLSPPLRAPYRAPEEAPAPPPLAPAASVRAPRRRWGACARP